VNPASFSVTYTKVQQFTDRTRFGFQFHAWGEEQPKISITAKCGAFVSGVRGVQYASKRDSYAWQNLMNAFHLYRNNGYIYDTIGKSNAHHFIGALSIHYDQWVYYGHMESFNWTYDDQNQLGGVEFQIEFVVSAMVDTAQQTFVVMPMKSPTPNPGDRRYVGLENRGSNRAGEFSIGLDTDGFPIHLSTQGRLATGSELGTLFLGGTEMGRQHRGVGIVPGSASSQQGFKAAESSTSLPGQRAVITTPTNGKPFGF